MSFNINKIELCSMIKKENMRLKLSSLLAAASMLCGQAFAAPAPALPANADIRDSGFVLLRQRAGKYL